MRPTFPGRGIGFSALLLAVAVACSASEESEPPRNYDAGGSNSGGTIAIGDGGEYAVGKGGSGNTVAVGSGGDGTFNGFAGACAADITKGELIPLDVHIMLDTSGSMLDMTGFGSSLWTDVNDAIQAFLLDDSSAGIGVGIQYFPLPAAGVPETCDADVDCGDAGPCWLEVCAGNGNRCTSNANCGPFGPCGPMLTCSDNEHYSCPYVGFECIDTFMNDLGTCQDPGAGHCEKSASCDGADYAVPAEPIQVLPDGAEGILDSLATIVPEGNTPTYAALLGALTYAQQWAADHDDHTVVTLFATDGLPTQCTPQDFGTIAGLADEAYTGSPSINTYVIGVFPPGSTAAQESLDLIADAGGTQEAIIIDNTQDVVEQFLAALNAIRGSKLDCEFQVPEAPAGEELDYDGQVNVQFTSDAGSEVLPYVGSPGGCGLTQGGWYYDLDPAEGETPTKIRVCPSTCNAFQDAVGGQVEIALGCETVTTVVK